METSRLCRKPDSKGQFNMRCRCFFTPRGEDEPRQCRAAAQRGTLYCAVHQMHTVDGLEAVGATDVAVASENKFQ